MKKLEEEIKDKAEIYSKSRRFGVWVDDAIEAFTKGYNACLQDNRWRKVSEELPSHDDGLVVVKVRNKNKEDGIFLYDICYIDEETHTWSERYHTWEDIIEWKPII